MQKKVILEVLISGGVLNPAQLKDLLHLVEEALPASTPGLVVILSGRMPVWAFSALCHFYHPALTTATYDPRLNGGVVTATHTNQWKIGDILDVTDAERVEVVVV